MGEPDLFLFSLCCWDTCPGLSADPSQVVRKDKNLVSMAKKKSQRNSKKEKNVLAISRSFTINFFLYFSDFFLYHSVEDCSSILLVVQPNKTEPVQGQASISEEENRQIKIKDDK